MKYKYIIFTILILLLVLMQSIWIFKDQIPWLRNQTFIRYAQAVLAACKDEQFAPNCYDREIPKLMDTKGLSMEDAFAVTRLVQKEDEQYLYCHVLAHKISFRETERDIAKWKDVVARCPTTMCNNGCQHGALMRRFNAEYLTDAQIEELKPDLADVCEPRGTWNPSEVERSMCYHAIGHLAMYITEAEIPRALGVCEGVGVKSDGRNYVQTCTEGVFMSVYQPLEPEDFALVKDVTPKPEGVGAFCSPYTGLAWDACHRESWAINRAKLRTPQGLVDFCSYTNDAIARHICFGAVMNNTTVELVVITGGSADGLRTFCTGLPTGWRGHCFAYAAKRLIQIDPVYMSDAVGICTDAVAAQTGDTCFRELAWYGMFSFHKDSKELRAYCQQLPEEWRQMCIAGPTDSQHPDMKLQLLGE